MFITTHDIKQIQKRLNFDPVKRRQSLRGTRPVDNENKDRVNKRIAMMLSQGVEPTQNALERIIADNDLMNVNYLERGLVAAKAVGRVNVRGTTGDLAGYGTGFMISSRLLITNNHVLMNAENARNSQVEFNYQYDSKGRLLPSVFFTLRPDEFFFTDKKLDFTVVAVAEKSDSDSRPLSEFGWILLNPQQGKVLIGEYVTIIQHPGGEPKQIAVRENQLIELHKDVVWYITDTAAGSSGSPVFNDQWQVVALHHMGVPEKDKQGRYLTIDGRVWNDQMDESKMKWKANEGVRVSRIVETLKAKQGGHKLIKQLLNSVASDSVSAKNTKGENVSTSDGAGTLTGDAAVQIGDRNADGCTITIPLHVDLRLGDTGTGGDRTTAGSSGGTILQEVISIDPDYSNRKGYDAEFLGKGNKKIPMPAMTKAMEAKAAINKQSKGGKKYILPYNHFSVVLNKVRRMAFFTAVNIDGKLAKAMKRESDKWIFDPRIERSEQTGPDVYKSNPLDIGHLVRRLDPTWGTTTTIAKKANDDTFHFSNAAPQHERLNRDTWNELEDFLLKNAMAQKMKISVFTGPVFSDNDHPYKGTLLPLQFWKVVAMVKKDGSLSATAFMLSQASLINNLEVADFSFDGHKTYQVSVKKIEQLTGLRFGSLKKYDPKSKIEADVLQEIRGFEDIVV